MTTLPFHVRLRNGTVRPIMPGDRWNGLVSNGIGWRQIGTNEIRGVDVEFLQFPLTQEQIAACSCRQCIDFRKAREVAG